MQTLTVIVNIVILGINLPVSTKCRFVEDVELNSRVSQPVAIACAVLAYPFDVLRKL